MLKTKSEIGKRKRSKIEQELLLQEYSRQFSIAHTVFSTYFEIVSSLIFGTTGIVLSLVQANIIPWNKYYLSQVFFIDLYLILIVTSISLSKWYSTRSRRAEISRELRGA